MIAIYDINRTLTPYVSNKIKNQPTFEIKSYLELKNILTNDLYKYTQVLVNTDTIKDEELDNILPLINTTSKQIKVLFYDSKNGIPTVLNTRLFNQIPSTSLKEKKSSTEKANTTFKPITNLFASKYEHICIGVSTGGPATLEMVIPQFPEDIDVSIVVIQHMLRGNYIYKLCERLNKISQIEVKVAEDGEFLKKGVAYFPPPGKHAYYKRHSNNEVSIHLTDKYPKNDSTAIFETGHKFIHIPSIDIGMESASDIYKDKMVAVILTGMGSDGALALKYARDNGAHTLSESKETCVIYGMPKVAFEKGGSMEVLKHYLIPNRILEIINYRPKLKLTKNIKETE